ncbi:hypothetical protein [Erythrobacter sp. SD-21]|uniref:hypothetical protein n=1 Tax=Erythrobacter sp. SD-21 TaxID=161528 RepID=UPI0012EA23A9|nr:hypothetical protein [Erythrobacter sp. SD-21]
MIDQFIRLIDRHRRLVSIVGAIWFAVGCAVYAKLLTLPAIPFLTDDVALYSGAAYNAIWWGFARRAIERRGKNLMTKSSN